MERRVKDSWQIAAGRRRIVDFRLQKPEDRRNEALGTKDETQGEQLLKSKVRGI